MPKTRKLQKCGKRTRKHSRTGNKTRKCGQKGGLLKGLRTMTWFPSRSKVAPEAPVAVEQALAGPVSVAAVPAAPAAGPVRGGFPKLVKPTLSAVQPMTRNKGGTSQNITYTPNYTNFSNTSGVPVAPRINPTALYATVKPRGPGRLSKSPYASLVGNYRGVGTNRPNPNE